MSNKKQLNVRIPSEIFDKIDNSGKSKQDLVEEALMLYFDSNPDSKSNQNDSKLIAEMLALQKEIQFKDAIIKAKEDNIKDLQNQAGFLISEFQRINKINEQLLLLPAPTEPVKRWWQFWKK